jgi:hypothetical protein
MTPDPRPPIPAPRQQQEFSFSAIRFVFAVQPGIADAGIVKNEEGAWVKEAGQCGNVEVAALPRPPVENEEAFGAPLYRRPLGDKLRRQVKREIRRTHL